MDATGIVGFIASVVSFVLWWPQAARVWQRRHDAQGLAGVSIASQGLLLANAALWGVYAILTHAFWVGAPGLINAPLAVATIVLVHRARRRRTPEAPVARGCPNCGWDEPAPHRIFITAPPGYGSRMTCSPETAAYGHPIADDRVSITN